MYIIEIEQLFGSPFYQKKTNTSASPFRLSDTNAIQKNLLLQPHSRQYEMHLFANMNVVTVSVNRTSSEKIPHTGDTESLQRVDSSTNTKTEKN